MTFLAHAAFRNSWNLIDSKKLFSIREQINKQTSPSIQAASKKL
jgi:hypothetical protein